jgi:hypothetical protein
MRFQHDFRLVRTSTALSSNPSLGADAPGTAADSLIGPLHAAAGSKTVITAGCSTSEQLLPLDAGGNIAVACQAAFLQGFSLVLRDIPKRSRAVALLVECLELCLGLPAGANLYYTPPGDSWTHPTMSTASTGVSANVQDAYAFRALSNCL